MLGANIENINSRSEVIDNNIADINTSLEQKKSIYKEKEEKVNEIKVELNKQNTTLNNLREELQNYKNENRNIDIKIQNNNYSQKEYSSKLQIYKDMEKHNEGFNRGVKEVLKNKNLSGICGALGQVITTKAEYEKAIEAALGAYMQNIITTDQFAAKNAIAYLKKNNMGRVTFLPMNVIKSKRINENTINSKTPYIKIASDLVEFDEQYRDIIENILGRTIVIDNIDNGIKFANETNHKFKVVTLDGDILNPGGSLTGGSLKTSTNILSRKRLISDFEEKIQVVHKKDLKNRADYARITTLYTGLVLRARQPGDRFRPAGRGLSKPLRKWMNETGVPNELRDTLPLLASGSEILWVCGEGFADGLAPDTESRWILHLDAEIETQEEKTNEYAR